MGEYCSSQGDVRHHCWLLPWLWKTLSPERLRVQEGLDLRRKHCRGACPKWLGHVLFLVMLLGGSIREWGILDALFISGDCPIMCSILGALGRGMLKFVKGIIYISRHGQV
jgi:hypothetical protein